MPAILHRFVTVEPGEVKPLFASAAFFFFVLTALMVLRPARESLGMQQGIDSVRWLFMGTAVVTLAVNPVFGFLVSRFRRLVFISATYLFFAASLLGFWALLVMAPAAIGEASGQVFYVWFSVFNLFATMLFWALMADRYTTEQSKRLFGAIAVGGTVGAITGPIIAATLAEAIGTPGLLLVAAGSLVLAVLCAFAVTRLQPERRMEPGEEAAVERVVIGGSAWEGVRAVVRSPFLFGISVYVLILAVIATFLYFTRLQMVAALGDDVDMQTRVFAQIDMWTQVTTLVLQLLVTGQLMKRVGVPFTLALLPITVALGFIGLAMVASLAVLTIFQAIFNAVQRAIMRPARETLFTVIDREEKYKAKAFIDTFVYRGGDVVGAQTEGLLGSLGLGVLALTSVAVPLAAVWGILGVWLGRAQRTEGDRRNERATTPRPVPLGTPG
jgi:ATP:ADP antiporter, AAA family